MEHLGVDLNATGSVMTRAELEEQRRKRGNCLTCGRRCFKKKMFKMVPITDNGMVLDGRCLYCKPLEVANVDTVLPAPVSVATNEQKKRFEDSQRMLDSQSGRNMRSGSVRNSSSATTSFREEPQRRNPPSLTKAVYAISAANKLRDSYKASHSQQEGQGSRSSVLSSASEPAIAPQPQEMAANASVEDSRGVSKSLSDLDPDRRAIASARSPNATVEELAGLIRSHTESALVQEECFRTLSELEPCPRTLQDFHGLVELLCRGCHPTAPQRPCRARRAVPSGACRLARRGKASLATARLLR